MQDDLPFTQQQVKAFQTLLLDARRNRGLTQVQAANEIGVSQTLISNLERGPSSGMRIGELFRVLAYYRIEPNTIAEVLGYWDSTIAHEANPRMMNVFQALRDMPEVGRDGILTAIELMLRGATSRQ